MTPPSTRVSQLNGPRRNRPETTQDLGFWWDGLTVGELRLQRCAGCGDLRHPPQIRCVGCGSLNADWIIASGAGHLHTFVVYHAPVLPETDYPYTVGVVDLVEGTRVIAPLYPNDGAGLRIGIPLTLGWLDEDPPWPYFASAG